MFGHIKVLKKVGVGEFWGEGARRVVVAHGRVSLRRNH